MPELPEVQTTVLGLKKTQPSILGAGFLDLWTDLEKFKKLKKQLTGRKIRRIWRRGKNIIFDLSGEHSLLIHQKMTGHLLYGRWKKDKANSYIHLVFFLDNKQMLALSDLRKFAKVELWKRASLIKKLGLLGPEPLERSFSFKEFLKTLGKRKGRIKQVLMNQEIIAGIGNIYSDEILWEARVHPFRRLSNLNKKELKNIYQAIKKILKKALKLKGTSISDYRDIKGEKGFFEKARKVYQRESEECFRCKTLIQRKKMGGRSVHFCPSCQKL